MCTLYTSLDNFCFEFFLCFLVNDNADFSCPFLTSVVDVFFYLVMDGW